MDLRAIAKKDVRFAIGLMSGSSCDGVDAALVRLKGTGADLRVKLVKFRTYPFSQGLRSRLLAPNINAREVCLLNSALGERLAEAAADMLEVAREEMCEVDFVASHGHTLAHIPPREGNPSGTLQVGEPAIIAERTGLPAISDFRQQDMAVGGQGAPLVPYADWILFHRKDRTVVCLNIGGIANMTVVTPKLEDVLAFDTGPGNMAIDGAIRLLTRGVRDMDTDGAIAAKGVVVDEFLDYLLDHPYFGRVPPKSTGREEFGPEVYLQDALASRRDHSLEDLVTTVTRAVAYSIIRAFTRFVKPRYKVARMIVSGGGAHNRTLLKRLGQGLPDVTIRLSDEYGFPGDAREAVAFAILGNETICGGHGNVPQATGAQRGVILGKITTV